MSLNVRTKKFKNKNGTVREYLYIVENKRVDKKPKQINIACLGRVEKLNESGQLDRIIKALVKFSKEMVALKARDDLIADWSKEYGALPIFRHLWKKLGFDRLFSRYANERDYRFDVAEAIFSMVCNHLMEPRSERGTYRWKEDIYEPLWDNIALHHYYRALDFLIDRKRDMEIEIFNRVVNLFNQELDLIMFDTTTVVHWGDGEHASILQRGYSKDRRNDLKQIMVGLLMTKDGYPVGHEVFRGNFGDLNAFKVILNKLRHRFPIGRLILVCDRGMISRKNLEALDSLEFQYILGVRMRKMKKETREKLLSKEDFDVIIPGKLWVKEKTLDGRRYIVCHNPDEAVYQKKKREYFRKILEEKVESRSIKEWVVKNGYRKYITIKNAEVILDEEKLEAESQYDGMWVLLTNTGLSSKEASLYYKGLWQIEQCFREMKNNLEMGPLYHWKERRIRAHVFVCFLSLILKTALKKKLHKLDPDALYCDVMDKVGQIKVVHLTLDDLKATVRTELPDGAYLAFQAAGIRPPDRVINLEKTAKEGR